MKKCFMVIVLFILIVLTVPAYGFMSDDDLQDCSREIIIKFKEPIPDDRKESFLKTLGARRIQNAYKNVFTVAEIPEGSLPSLLQALAKNHAIAYAEPNSRLKAYGIPNDPDYSLQWHLHMINLERAWDYSTGENVTVAVLDSGINPYGNDGFGDRVLPGFNAFLNSTVRWEDYNYHGTHVAGTIGQETNNGTGVAGIAYAARLLPVKVLNRWGFGFRSSVASGIRWAADQGADIINMSLGEAENSQAISEAVEYAYSKGVTLIAAAGNDSGSDVLAPVSYPAAGDHVIAVGAVDYNGDRAFYSNGGPELDLVAPGGDKQVDDNNDGYPDGVYQETFSRYLGYTRFAVGWDYVFLQGTSMASPHVTGVAALLKALHPEWGPDDIYTALVETAKDLGSPGKDDAYGYGLLDAYAAVVY